MSIFNKKIFLTKNKNIALYLKNLFQDKIYIYFQDNIWIITNDRIRGYAQYDISLDSISELNVKDNFTIDLSDNFLIPSIGWEIQNKGHGLVSQGYTSSLLLKIKGISCEKKNKIKFHIEKYYRDLENNIKFSLNDGNYKIVNFDKSLLVFFFDANSLFSFLSL